MEELFRQGRKARNEVIFDHIKIKINACKSVPNTKSKTMNDPLKHYTGVPAKMEA